MAGNVGSNAPRLVETPDVVHNFIDQCLNLFAVPPPPCST